MAEYSLIYRSRLEGSSRFDAEYYKKKYLLIDAAIKKHDYTSLGKEVLVFSKGIFNIQASSYTTEGIPFVRISNLKGFYIDDAEIAFIPEAVNNLYHKTALTKHDIILSKTATPAACIVYYDICNCSQDTIALKLKSSSKVTPQFLTCFLNSRFGFPLMERLFTGNIQMHLNLVESRNILIPIFTNSFQSKISEIVDDAYHLSIQTKQSFAKAKQIFLSALGLEKWKPNHTQTYQRTFSEVQNSFRIDGEHFQPKYDELKKIILNNANYCKTIGSMKIFNQRGTQPKYFEDGTLRVINSQHILETHLDYDNFERTNESFWNTEKESRVFNNDILIYTTGANIGRANVYLQYEKALASNHTNILRVKDENPIYVGFALNSIVGRMQTEKMKTGSAQAEIYPSAFNQFIIPFIDKKKQDVIAKLYVQSYELSKQSKLLIAKAKQAIEIAIEHNEKTAIKFLEDKT